MGISISICMAGASALAGGLRVKAEAQTVRLILMAMHANGNTTSLIPMLWPMQQQSEIVQKRPNPSFGWGRAGA